MTGAFLIAALGASVAAFVLGGVYYTVFEGPLADARQVEAPPEAPRWVYAVEFVRSLVIATVLAGIAHTVSITSWVEGLGLALALWIGFPAMLWLGAMIHERTEVRLAAIHAGDWLLKLATIGVIVGAWSQP